MPARLAPVSDGGEDVIRGDLPGRLKSVDVSLCGCDVCFFLGNAFVCFEEGILQGLEFLFKAADRFRQGEGKLLTFLARTGPKPEHGNFFHDL